MRAREQILVITDVLLGAIHADGPMTPEEDRAVRRLLAELACTPGRLPIEVDLRIREFDARDLDLDACARAWLRRPPMRSRRLLELVAALTDADGTDLREDAYLRDLAGRLGVRAEDYADLVVEHEVLETPPRKNERAGVTRTRPPPIPEAARRPGARPAGGPR